MPDLSLADELRFESWPEEDQLLAIRYLDEHWEKVNKREAYEAGFDSGFERGKLVGFRLGREISDRYHKKAR